MRRALPLRFFIFTLAAAAELAASAQNVGISTNGAAPDPAAIVDLNVASLAVKRGLFIPRMTEAQRTAIPVTAADNGLLVYQTDQPATYTPNDTRGLWYYSSSAAAWLHLSSAGTAWSTKGNAIANTAEYLGTRAGSANVNLLFRTISSATDPQMQMGYNGLNWYSGFLGVGTPAPATERLEVNGAVRLALTHYNAAPINEGTIRYGTVNGNYATTGNYYWHFGTVDTSATLFWQRMENAENFITPPQNYAKDTVQCAGASGYAMRGVLSTPSVTNTSAAPCNYYSPFATNFAPDNAEGSYRVEYLYRYAELVDAGICFPATINAVAFYALEGEDLTATPPTTITGEVRGAATTVGGLQGTSAQFGTNNTAPYMDDGVRLGTVRNTFSGLSTTAGWVDFTLSPAITLAAGQNLIIDVVWTRNNHEGAGPKVELENPGFYCTKWVLRTNQTGSTLIRYNLQDQPITSGATVNSGVNDPHQSRPVTRFSGSVVSATTTPGTANYIQYDGGLMIGDPTWAATAGNFKGPGTVKAQEGVYDGFTQVSDHVFDRYFDGTVRPEDRQRAEGYAYVGLGHLRKDLEKTRHLPNMPSRTEWEAKGGASLGQLNTGLWETVENQSLYISQMEKDLGTLETMAFGKDLTPEKVHRLITEVHASRRLTEAQKLHLVDELNRLCTPANTPAKP